MDRCLKFKHEVKAVVAPCKEVFKYTKDGLKTIEKHLFSSLSRLFSPRHSFYIFRSS